MAALLVLALIVACLLVEGIRMRLSEGRGPVASFDPAAVSLADAGLDAPLGIFHAKGHTWASVRDDGDVVLGLDSFARHALGAPDKVDLPRAGMRVEKGESLFTVERDGRRLSFVSPLTGRVIAVNPSRGGRVGGEWLVRMVPARLGAEIRSMLLGEQTLSWLRGEVVRFREFLMGGMSANPAMAVLPDGGYPAAGALAHVPEERWQEFSDEFLADEA